MQLPADLYEEVTERLCYVGADGQEENPESSNPFGIYISDLVVPSPYCNEEIVLAICGNSKRGENAEEFIRYLLHREDGVLSGAAE